MLSSHVPSSTAVFLTFLVPVCLFAGIQSQISVTPAVKCVLPEESIVTVTCKTTTKALLWIYNRTDQKFYNKDSMPNEQADLGIFTVRLTMIDVVGDNVNLTSLATVSVSSLVDRVTVITCDGDGDGLNGRDALLINGPPSPSSVTSIVTTQSSTNSSSLLISWSMSDCAVQYVVTIINSSDGSVYLNITTSDTNTTVTLPTGVEYCVTVLGVDSIGRRGPPSLQQRYPIVPTSTVSVTSTVYLKSTTTSVSNSSPTVSPGVGGINAVAIAVPIVVVVVIVAVGCGIMILIIYLVKNKDISPKSPTPTHVELGSSDIFNEVGKKANETETEMGISLTHPNACSPAPPVCMSQVFYYRTEPNHWRIVFTFFPINLVDMVNKLYHDADERGPSIEKLVFQDKRIEVKYPKVMGWKISVTNDISSVERASIEEYSSDNNKPPNIELVIVPQDETKKHGDLNITVTLMGIIPSFPITIFKMYVSQLTEQPEPQELPTEQRANRQSFTELQPACGDVISSTQPSVNNPLAGVMRNELGTEAMQCVCQVFYLKETTKWWNVKFAFCFRAYLDDMKAFYHNAIIGECIDVQFMDTSVPIYALSNNMTKNGWNVISFLQDKVTEDEVNLYTGEGEPPHCKATLGAVVDRTTLNADFTVALHGAQPPNDTITVTSAIEPPTEYTPTNPHAVPTDYVSQVFYQKQRVNVWIVTFSFFHKSHLEEVKKLYLYEDVGPTIGMQLKNKEIKLSATDRVTGWNYELHHQQVSKAAVEQYTGEGEPPYCEMTLRGVMTGTASHDLTLPVTLTEVKDPTTIILKREAQKSLEEIFGKSEHDTDSFDDTIKYLCGVFYHKLDEINHWKATIAFFPEHKHQKVNTVYKSKLTGPTAEFEFKRGSNPSVKVGFKKPISKEWNVVVSPKHEKVKKAAVDAYGLSGKYDDPPYCEMTLKAVSDSAPPPDLTVSLTLTGGRLLEPITLERKPENLSPSSPGSNNQGTTSHDSKSLEEEQVTVQASSTTLPESPEIEAFTEIGLPVDSQPADTCMQSAMDRQEDEDRTDTDIKNAEYRIGDPLPITAGHYDN